MELSYQSLKTANIVRESEDLRVETRKRNLLLLISSYLTDHGYLDTKEVLERESKINFHKWQVCDNVDLDSIVQEYESYYFVKFQKQPKIVKKTDSHANDPKFKSSRMSKFKSYNNQQISALPEILGKKDKAQARSAPVAGRSTPSSFRKQRRAINKPPVHPESTTTLFKTDSKPNILNGEFPHMKTEELGLTVASATKNNTAKQKGFKREVVDVRAMLHDAIKGASGDIENHSLNDKIQKPLGGFAGYNQEMRDLASVISRDIYLNDPNVKWSDIIGLSHAKKLMKEAVIYPIKYPQLFTGILTPWKGVLLYGPPGNGKTLLAKAVATECNTTFFNISASTIVSKWRGDSEKLVRVLFELARFHAPSTIFLDELESVMSQRGSFSSPGGEHEGSRRMKTELLVQMDGLAKSDDLVFVLAASNLPWELDQAMLRRLEKRILVDLPTHEARKCMVEKFLPRCNSEGGLVIKTELDYDLIAEKTEGYSGSDLKLVSKEAAMRVVRKIFDTLESHTEEEELPDFQLDEIRTEDILDVLDHTKPSADKYKKKYQDWKNKYESV